MALSPLRRANSLRARLLAISVLTLLLATAALIALVRAAADVRERLDERAKEELTLEIERLSHIPGAAGKRPGVTDAPNCRTGRLSSGVATSTGDPALPPGLVSDVGDALLREPMEEIRIRSFRTKGHPALAATYPVRSGVAAWAVLEPRDPPGLRSWRWIGIGLAATIIVLAASMLHVSIAIRRDVESLRCSTAALSINLGAPLLATRLAEFTGIGEGLHRMAEQLRQSDADRSAMRISLEKQARLATLGRLAVGMAHEVRNPLAAIKLRVDLLAQGGVPEVIAREDVALISSEVVRLDRLLEDLLLLAGRKAGRRYDRDLGEIVRGRAAAAAPWVKSKGVCLEVTGHGNAPVDEDAIARVVDNLLRNAVEASGPGGRVDILVSGDEETTEVVVEDGGPGVAAEHAPQLFEPFFTTRQGGTGLGLSLSQGVAHGHGGALHYERIGERTRFRLSLPRRSVGADG